MKKDKQQKREQTKRRYEAIKDLMSTFAMSTVAVVAVVTLIPASPQADITKVVSLEEEIVYQVVVTDEDNALDLESLVVVLENQMEYYEHPIELGNQSGFFEDLESNTQYRLSVYGNKGFGQERLATRLVVTNARVGGTILAVTEQSSDFHTSYLVDVSINDPNTTYTDVTLYYGYRMHPDEELMYSTVGITELRSIIELMDIHTSEAFHIYLEATTEDGTEVLDEIWITPSYSFYGSVYKSYTSKDAIGFSLYGDMSVDDVQYTMNVYKGEFKVVSKTVSQGSDIHGDIELVVDGLAPNTTYLFECVATFTNPITLRTDSVVIYEEESTTLGEYSYTYTTEIVDEYLEVSITVNDPSHYFQLGYYILVDTSGEFDNWLAEESYGFTPDGEEKTTTFSILLPDTGSYRITIGIRNETDFNIKHIIEVIHHE